MVNAIYKLALNGVLQMRNTLLALPDDKHDVEMWAQKFSNALATLEQRSKGEDSMGMRDPQVLALIEEASDRLTPCVTDAWANQSPVFARAMEDCVRANLLNMRPALRALPDDSEQVRNWVRMCSERLHTLEILGNDVPGRGRKHEDVQLLVGEAHLKLLATYATDDWVLLYPAFVKGLEAVISRARQKRDAREAAAKASAQSPTSAQQQASSSTTPAQSPAHSVPPFLSLDTSPPRNAPPKGIHIHGLRSATPSASTLQMRQSPVESPDPSPIGSQAPSATSSIMDLTAMSIDSRPASRSSSKRARSPEDDHPGRTPPPAPTPSPTLPAPTPPPALPALTPQPKAAIKRVPTCTACRKSKKGCYVEPRKDSCLRCVSMRVACESPAPPDPQNERKKVRPRMVVPGATSSMPPPAVESPADTAESSVNAITSDTNAAASVANTATEVTTDPLEGIIDPATMFSLSPSLLMPMDRPHYPRNRALLLEELEATSLALHYYSILVAGMTEKESAEQKIDVGTKGYIAQLERIIRVRHQILNEALRIVDQGGKGKAVVIDVDEETSSLEGQGEPDLDVEGKGKAHAIEEENEGPIDDAMKCDEELGDSDMA